jgi:CRP-like cAMP-binding protein
VGTGHQAILGMFASHAFLRDLEEHQLMVLASGARPFTVNSGDYLGQEQQTANHFFLIQCGHVSTESCKQSGEAMQVQTVGPGEAVDRRPAHAVSLGTTTLCGSSPECVFRNRLPSPRSCHPCSW